MNRWTTRTRILLLLLIGAVALLGYVLYSRYVALFPAAQAVLTVESGSAHITRNSGIITDATSGDDAVEISAGDVVETNGFARLSFTESTQSDLFAGTRVRLDHLGRQQSDLQAAVALLSGQIVSRVGSFADRRSYYRLMLVPDAVIETQSAQFVAITRAGRALIGAVKGAVSVTAKPDRLTLAEGSGMAIDASKPPTPPQPWALLRVPIYRPDGSALSLPISLAQDKENSITLLSDQVMLVPPGTYSLSLDLLQQYTLPNVELTPGKLTELPLTLSELTFTVTDANGRLLPTPALIAAGSHQERIEPNVPVLLGPGTASFSIARSDAPDLAQSTGKFEVLPGQRVTVQMRNDLFGGGLLQVDVSGVDGTIQSARVSVYPDGADESAPPSYSFRSETSPVVLPRGKYVVVVIGRNSIAARYLVEIRTSQTASIKVETGTLVVNYADAAGHTLSRLVYVASEQELARLNIPIGQTQRTLYGYALSTGQPLTLPAGRYVVRVADPRAESQTVTVTSGQNTQLTITASSP